MSETTGRPTRERATVAAFKPDVPKEEDEEALKPVGTGDALGDIENVNEMIGKKLSSDEALSRLHSLCFGKAGTKTTRKKNLRIFNGFAPDTDVEAKTDKLLSQKKLTVSDLKAVCEVLCLEKSGSKDELAARVVKFLADPSSDTCKKASTQAKKRKGADAKKGKKAKKSKKDANKPKRAPGAFMLFSKAMRPTVLAENPGIAFTEVGKELGRRWGLLSAEEKEAYKQPAAAEEEEEAEGAEEEEADKAEDEDEPGEEEEEGEEEGEAEEEDKKDEEEE